jgi:hypothetical protein
LSRFDKRIARISFCTRIDIAMFITGKTPEIQGIPIQAAWPAGAAVERGPHFCEYDLGECRTDLLPLLHEMSALANVSGDLPAILNILLRLMQRHMKVVRGMVSLFEPGTGRILSMRVLA